MVCQRVCPQNRKFLQWIKEKKKFSQEETGLLLKMTSCDRLPEKTKKKLQHLDLLEDIDTLPRNLSVLLKK
jgi:epoxyqueuosine reductase